MPLPVRAKIKILKRGERGERVENAEEGITTKDTKYHEGSTVSSGIGQPVTGIKDAAEPRLYR